MSQVILPGGTIGILGAGQLGLERAEAQLRAQYAVAVLVHEGRRVDHLRTLPVWTLSLPTGPNG